MKNKNRLAFLILAIFLFALAIALPILIGKIPDYTTRFLICCLLLVIVVLLATFNLILIIKERKYVTTIFLVIVNAILVLALACSFLLSSLMVNTNNLETIVYLSNIDIAAKIIFFVGLLLNQFLQSDRFLKKS